MSPTITYPGDALPTTLRRPYRLIGLLARTRQMRLLPAALGLWRHDRLELRLAGAHYSLRTRPLKELWIDLGILWELSVADVYPLPSIDWTGCVVDLGAHRGHFALWAASCLPGAEIHAYEPNAENADELARAVARNGCTGRVSLYREAVGAEDGVRRFSRDRRSDAGHLATEGDPVQTVSLATVLSRCGARPVYMKVDVEGAEHEAFAALARLGPEASSRITRVSAEWHEPPRGETDVRRSLEKLGFTVASRMLGIGNGIVQAWRSEPL